MSKSASYSSELLASPDRLRTQILNAHAAYHGVLSPDQWELRVSAEDLEACLPTAISRLFNNEDSPIVLPTYEKLQSGLRAIGHTRPPNCHEQEYDLVIEVGFKGTTHRCDWMTNFSYELAPVEIGSRQGCIHAGFQRAYLLLQEQMHKALERCRVVANAQNVLVCLAGHSLGGALATLAAYDLSCSTTHNYNYSVRVVTMGCPRLGNADFAKSCASAVPNMARFVNKLDPIPCVPPNHEDPYDNPGAACEILTATPLSRFFDATKVALGAVGFCHAAPCVILDPETSKTAHLVIGGLTAAMGNKAADVACELFHPHSLSEYLESVETALQRTAAKTFPRLPSVGTWLRLHDVPADSSCGPFSVLDCPGDETRELLAYFLSLLKDLEGVDIGQAFLIDFSWHIAEVLEHGLHLIPRLAESQEGTDFLREAQRKIINVLPMLAATSEKAHFSKRVLRQLRKRPFGQMILQKGEEQMRAATSNPDMLKAWVASLDVYGADGTSFKEKCIGVVAAAKALCLDLLNNKATKQLLVKVGVDLDENGGLRLKRILEKRELLLDTPLGAEILLTAQKRVLSMMSALNAFASNNILSKQLELYLSELEASEQGMQLLAWGREQLKAAKDDPAFLHKLVSSLDEMRIERFVECFTSLFSSDLSTYNSVVSCATERCLDILRIPATQKLLERAGVEVAGDSVDLAKVIEKSQQLMETREGAELLRTVQNRLLEVIAKVEYKMDDAGFKDTSIGMLEKTKEGRTLLNWASIHLAQARNNPEAFKNWLGAADAASIANSHDGFVEAATNQILDFLLSQIPLIKVPDIQKEKDGSVFTLSNLILGKCDIKKNNVDIKISATRSSFRAKVEASMSDSAHRVGGVESDSASPEISQMTSPRGNMSNCSVTGSTDLAHEASAALLTHLKSMKASRGRRDSKASRNRPDSKVAEAEGQTFQAHPATTNNAALGEVGLMSRTVGSAASGAAALEEIVRVTARNIAVEFTDLSWTFQRNNEFPYFKDEGCAQARANGICIVLSFGLQGTEVDGKQIPCFTLSSHSVVMNDFTLEIKETELSWLYNTAVRWFQQAVKEYVTRSLQEALAENIESWLGMFNAHMQPFMPFLLKRVGITKDMLSSAIMKAPYLPSSRHGLLVFISGARGLKRLNRMGDKPWCFCELRSASLTTTGIHCSTKVAKGTLCPQWRETHLLAPWCKGQSLLFTVYDQGALHSKAHGSCALPGNWFHPAAFEGNLEIGGCDSEAVLSVSVSVVHVEEYSAAIIQRVGPLGLQVDVITLVVQSVTPYGRMEESCLEEGLREGLWIQPGDFLATVDCREFGASPIPVTAANVKLVLDAIETGQIARLSWRRSISHLPTAMQPAEQPLLLEDWIEL